MRKLWWMGAAYLVGGWAQEPLGFASYLGGEGTDTVSATLALPSGTYYVAGSTTSREGIFATQFTGQRIFLARYSQDNRQEWLRVLPGSSVTALQADGDENVYLAGTGTTEAGLASEGTYMPSTRGGGPYVVKFRNDGEKIWGTFLSANGSATAAALAVDSEGRSAVCGAQTQGSIERTANAFVAELPNPNAAAGYCLVLSPDGAKLEYSTYLADSPDNFPGGVIFDGEGSLRVVGAAAAWGFPKESAPEGEDPRRYLFEFDPGTAGWSSIGRSEFQKASAIGANPERPAVDGEGGFYQFEQGTPRRKGPRIGAESIVVHPLNPDHICAILASGQLQCSPDGGARWQMISFVRVSNLIADPTTAGLFFYLRNAFFQPLALAPQAGVAPTAPSGLIGPADLLAVRRGEQRVFFATTTRGALYRASGDGAAFEIVAEQSRISRIFGSIDLLYGLKTGAPAGESLLRRSFDGGETWTDVGPSAEVIPGPYLEFRTDPTNAQRIAIRTRDAVWFSEDGAETWRSILDGLPNRRIEAIGFGAEGKLLAGSGIASIGYHMKIHWREGTYSQLLRQVGSGAASWTRIRRDGENGFRLLGTSTANDPGFALAQMAPREAKAAETVTARINAAGELVEGTAWGRLGIRADIAPNGEAHFWLGEQTAAPEGVEMRGTRDALNRDLLVIGSTDGALRGAWIPSLGLGGNAMAISATGDGTGELTLIGGVAEAGRLSVTQDAQQPTAGGMRDGALIKIRLPR